MMNRVGSAILVLVLLSVPLLAAAAQIGDISPRMKNAYRFQQDGWTYIHLEGSPADIGFQHGYLLAPEIQDAFQAIQLQMTHSTKRNWEFFRKTAREMLWPHVDPEYQQELQGISDGLKAQGVNLDVYDVVASMRSKSCLTITFPGSTGKRRRLTHPGWSLPAIAAHSSPPAA